MTRVSLDSPYFSDPRLEFLGKLIGASKFEARGRLLGLWHFAYTQARDVLTAEEINFHSEWFNHDGLCFAEAMVKAQLAEPNEQRFRLRGLQDRMAPIIEAKDRGRKGGLKSAAVRRLKTGSAIPFNATNTPIENNSL